eukprot:scaffold77491_cov37-Prasinocladus_malaysianus.AAC.1
MPNASASRMYHMLTYDGCRWILGDVSIESCPACNTQCTEHCASFVLNLQLMLSAACHVVGRSTMSSSAGQTCGWPGAAQRGPPLCSPAKTSTSGGTAKQALDAKALAQEQQKIAEQNEAIAVAAETKATMMLLLQLGPLSTPAEARAVAEAVAIANATSSESLAQPALFGLLEDLQDRPFWLMGQIQGPVEGYSLQTLAWSQDEAMPLLAAGFLVNGSVAVWTDAKEAPQSYTLMPSHSEQPVSGLAWADTRQDDGSQALASVHDDGLVCLWTVSVSSQLSTLDNFGQLPDTDKLVTRR